MAAWVFVLFFFSFSFFFFFWWCLNSEHMLARQALYQLSHSISPAWIFVIIVVCLDGWFGVLAVLEFEFRSSCLLGRHSSP
jgi:hypothetical protein